MRLYPFALLVMLLSCARPAIEYACRPCNLSCDDRTFSGPGKCPHCQMELLKEEDLRRVEIETGSGVFEIVDTISGRQKRVAVFYHRPKHFRSDSQVLIVLPGTGRSAESYRDAWVAASEEQGILILALLYPERMYGFEAYHLGGLVQNSNMRDRITREEGSSIVRLDESGLEFSVQPRPEQWLFNDFDRIFELAKQATGSRQQQYHLFGHSAGGHILHRLALFGRSQQVGRIFACNASFYTLPDWEVDFPFGLRAAPIDQKQLCRAFERELFLFLGEQDNEAEIKGTFLRSPTADAQGLGRLSRGNHFFERSREKAAALSCDFNWQKIVVPGAGHDHRLMAQAVAEHLEQ